MSAADRFIRERIVLDPRARARFDEVRDAFILSCAADERADTRELSRVLRTCGAVPPRRWERPRAWRGIRLVGRADEVLLAARAELSDAEATLARAVRARGQVVASMPDAARRASETAEAERAARERFDAARVAVRQCEEALVAAARGPQAKARPPRGPTAEERREEQLEAWEKQPATDKLASTEMRIATRERQLAEVQREQGRVRLAVEYQELEMRRGALCRDLAELRALRERTLIEVEATKEPDPEVRRRALEARHAELLAERGQLEARVRDLHRRRNVGGPSDRATRDYQRGVTQQIDQVTARLEEIHRELRGVERRLREVPR